ncbi:hypothetical protein D1007_52987 [Hordeum vulgare]|nr:hypothetical protein D1007_52987 [Hordeum vulgare]
MAGRDGGNRFNRGDGAAEGRFGRGGGRSGRGGGRERGGGGGGCSMVWMRDNDEGGSSNVDPCHGSSNKARWDADAMEQGESEKKSEETQSDEESEDVDDMLLIDSMAAEAEKSHMKEIEKQSTMGTSYEKIVVNSMQIVPNPVVHRKFSSYLDACVGETTVTEMKNDDKNYQKEDQAYFVQSPGGSCEDVDVVPTPPVLEEVQARFSKRTVGINLEHLGATAEKMTKKRNLQGNEPISENSFDVLSNMEIINMASHMGVNIPDDDLTVIDVIRELEKSRANIAKKINTDDKQQEEVLLITNAAGESSNLNTAWGDEEDIDEEGFKSVRSRKREKRKVNVKPEMVEVMKKGAEMLKANASQMLLLCGPPMPEPSKQNEGNDNWDEW